MAQKKVKSVTDGDTFTTDDGERVRLANVNAPEKGHRGAPQARKELRKLISRQQVNIEKVAVDRYGRTVANVKVGPRSVNKSMRQKGYK